LTLYWLDPQGERAVSQKKIFLVVAKRIIRLAHERNRAKRLIREICRERFRAAKTSFPVVVRVARTPEKLTMPLFKNCLDPLLEKALGL